MCSIFGTLQLDDDRLGILFNVEKINPPTGTVPVAEFHGDNYGVDSNRLDIGAEKPLKIVSFLRLRIAEGRAVKATNLVARE